MSREKKFASKVAELRNRYGLPQAQFGALIGASRDDVAHWEGGRTMPLKRLVDLVSCETFPLGDRLVVRDLYAREHPDLTVPEVPDPSVFRSVLQRAPTVEMVAEASASVDVLSAFGRVHDAYYLASGLYQRASTSASDAARSDAACALGQVLMSLDDFALAARLIAESAKLAGKGEPMRRVRALTALAACELNRPTPRVLKAVERLREARDVVCTLCADPMEDEAWRPYWHSIVRDMVLIPTTARFLHGLEAPIGSEDWDRLVQLNRSLRGYDEVGAELSGEVLVRAAAVLDNLSVADRELDALLASPVLHGSAFHVKRLLSQTLVMVRRGRTNEAVETATMGVSTAQAHGHGHYERMLKRAAGLDRRNG